MKLIFPALHLHSCQDQIQKRFLAHFWELHVKLSQNPRYHLYPFGCLRYLSDSHHCFCETSLLAHLISFSKDLPYGHFLGGFVLQESSHQNPLKNSFFNG